MGYHDIKVTGLGMRLMRRRANQTLAWLGPGARRVLEVRAVQRAVGSNLSLLGGREGDDGCDGRGG